MATHGHPGKYTWLVADIAPCTEREPAHHTMPAGGMHEPRLDAVTGGPGVKTTMAPQLHAALFPSAKSITRRERPRRAGVEQTPAPA